MGPEPYQYVVDYQEDVQGALEALREEGAKVEHSTSKIEC